MAQWESDKVGEIHKLRRKKTDWIGIIGITVGILLLIAAYSSG